MQLLSQTIRTYLANLPDELQLQLNIYLQSIKHIYNFHSNVFYPKVIKCEMKVSAICDLFHSHIDGNEFSIYHAYAAHANEAMLALKEYFNENVSKMSLFSTWRSLISPLPFAVRETRR